MSNKLPTIYLFITLTIISLLGPVSSQGYRGPRVLVDFSKGETPESEMAKLGRGEKKALTKKDLDEYKAEEEEESAECGYYKAEVDECAPDLGRVIGGRKAWQWPFIVKLTVLEKAKSSLKCSRSELLTTFCGATILDEYNLITASHCFDPKLFCKVQFNLGKFFYPKRNKSVENLITIEKNMVVTHENYQDAAGNLYNDIAIIKLKTSIKFGKKGSSGEKLQPICLPEEPTAINTSDCKILGWGVEERTQSSNCYTAPEQLQQGDVSVLPDDTCKRREGRGFDRKIQLCAGPSSDTDPYPTTCQGDSGGPLLCRLKNKKYQWTFVGITSHGPIPCAEKGRPAIYTRVSKFIHWINKKKKKVRKVESDEKTDDDEEDEEEEDEKPKKPKRKSAASENNQNNNY